MNVGLLPIAVVFLLLALVSGAIAKINSRRRATGKTTIGFGFRGTGFYYSQSDEVENFAYAWPIAGWISLGLGVVILVVALVT